MTLSSGLDKVFRGSLLLMSLLLPAISGGCGPAEKAPTTVQARVSGSVVIDGKPVKLDTAVTFYNTDEGATAAGKVDALGKFQLTGSMKSIGIPVGRYKVMIRPPEPSNVAPAQGSVDYEKMMKTAGSAMKTQAANSEIPAQFMTLETTPLIFEVREGDNNFDLDLAKLAK